MKSSVKYYKKFYVFVTLNVEQMLRYIIGTSELSERDEMIIAKIMASDNIRAYMEYVRATEAISCGRHVSIINQKIREYINKYHVANLDKNDDVDIKTYDLCEEFTYEGSYFMNSRTKMFCQRKVLVDITFHSKHAYNTLKLKDSKLYDELTEKGEDE